MESSSTPQKTPTKNKMKKNHHPRRFSDEQIKSLESIFEQESKLEPRKKLQIATDLALQPRQVAIWFQNKRARWKSKQIEQQFRHLKSNYDTLSSKFDDLKREKHSLQMQLQELNDRLKNRDGVNGDDERNIDIASCFGKTEDDEEFIRWSSGEEVMSQTWRSLSDSKWWES